MVIKVKRKINSFKKCVCINVNINWNGHFNFTIYYILDWNYNEHNVTYRGCISLLFIATYINKSEYKNKKEQLCPFTKIIMWRKNRNNI